MSNKSKVYGSYGGVTDQNHYIAPPSTPFTPQPASVPFYEHYVGTAAALLTSAPQTREFLISNEGVIMRRYLTARVGQQEFYEIKTLDNPNDVITYTTSLSGGEDLLLLDGGNF